MLKLERGQFKDKDSRIVVLRGVNFAADVKQPVSGTTSYVNCPCSLEEADKHYSKLRSIGYNCIRFLFTWDALQPNHPDEYNEEYIEFAIRLIRKAIDDYGFYVFMDPHQDIWSRFSGGSGAPLWTLHAVGFDHEYFEETHAAALWKPDAKKSIKMQWASNYHRLVCQTMFTLFFAGPEFAPKAEINNKNVGIYLKDKFFAALKYFMIRVQAADLGPHLLGWESINEPGHGLIGYDHLDKFPQSRTHVKLGTAPTPFQAMLLGQGIEQNVETFKFTSFGLKRIENSFNCKPKHSTWLSPAKAKELDKKYNWNRSWDVGCIWELHGLYDSKTKTLLNPYYFKNITHQMDTSPFNCYKNREGRNNTSSSETSDSNASSNESLNFKFTGDTKGMHLFVDNFYVRHWLEFSALVKEINPDWFQFMQAPVNTPPPDMEKLYPGVIDPSRVVYTPHFYDGLTLMLKRWRWLNVDAIGVMREIYANPLPALRFGDTRICQSFADQFRFLRKEAHERLGKDVALVMSEIGIPYDMDRKSAYTSGYWDNQIRAMDANLKALEQANINYTLWCYAVNNTHESGDMFAGEDLSIYSKDDEKSELEGLPENGLRAAASVIRPSPLHLAGEYTHIEFNMRKAVFTLTVIPRVDAPSTIYIPKYHFPHPRALVNINVTGGHVEIQDQILIWYHGDIGTSQTLMVQGTSKFQDSLYSYFEGIHRSLQVGLRQLKFASASARSGHYPKSMRNGSL